VKLFYHHIRQTTGVRHLALTVYRDIPIAVAEQVASEDDPFRDSILTDLWTRFPTGTFNAWGVPEGGATVVRRLEVGDAVLLAERVSEFGEVPVLCQIEVYFHHQLPSLSEALWGSTHYPYCTSSTRVASAWDGGKCSVTSATVSGSTPGARLGRCRASASSPSAAPRAMFSAC
jgi:hypothetical protein